MPQLSSGLRCSAALLTVFNIVFLLLSLVVMSIGIYILSDGDFHSIAEVANIVKSFSTDTVHDVAIVMIICGVFSAFLSGIGCFGSLLNKRSFLICYAFFLLLIIIVEFVIVILVLVYRDQIWTTFDSGFLDVFKDAYNFNSTSTIGIIETLENQLECCGVNGPFDYLAVRVPLPLSCYPSQSTFFLPFSTGCANAIFNWVWQELPWIVGVLGTFVLMEFFGLISSLVLVVALAPRRVSEDGQQLYSMNN